MTQTSKTVRHLRKALRDARDADRAAEMKAYMVSKRFAQYPGATQRAPQRFLGVSSPARKALVRSTLQTWPLEDRDAWHQAVRDLWEEKTYREEGYVAIDLLLGPARHRRFYDPDLFELLDRMVVTGAWWDYVDALASAFWTMLSRFRTEAEPRMLAYAEDEDIWRRRSAILSQLKARDATDFDLLKRCIGPSLTSNEFFLAKAIGWALRTYARTEPDRVRAYVKRHQEQLAPLARREALKHIGS